MISRSIRLGVLTAALADPDFDVRMAAAVNLAKLDGADVGPAEWGREEVKALPTELTRQPSLGRRYCRVRWQHSDRRNEPARDRREPRSLVRLRHEAARS